MSFKPASKCQCTAKRRFYCCSVCGAISFILTIFFALALVFNLADELFFLLIKEDLELTPDSRTLDEWETTNEAPLYKTFYLFETLNPDKYLMGDVPIVKEVGPFAYREYDTKLNLRWNSDESFLTYNRNVYYIFVPEKSIGDPHKYTITFLNVPLATILNQLEEIETMLIDLFGPQRAEFYMSMIDSQELFIEKTAYELLWGYTDPLLDVLVSMGLVDDATMRIETNTSNPEAFYRVNTGEKDINSVDTLSYWNSISKIAGWGTKDARRIYGSESKRFQPRIGKEDMPVIFIEQIFRHSHLVFNEEGTVHGIDLYYYKNERSLFSNVSEDPSNVGYYAFDFKYGMFNLTANMPAGMPVFSSKPHCLDCDPEYFKNVSGFQPNRKKHDSWAGIEPFTGFTMDGALRGQANFRILRNTLSRQLALVRDVTMYPWFYYQLDGVISEEKADEFKNQVYLPRLCLKIAVIILLCSLSITTLLVAGILCRSCYKEMHAKARTESGYKYINGSTEDEGIIKGSLNGSYKDYGSINGDVQDLESSTTSIVFSLSSLKANEDIQSDN